VPSGTSPPVVIEHWEEDEIEGRFVLVNVGECVSSPQICTSVLINEHDVGEVLGWQGGIFRQAPVIEVTLLSVAAGVTSQLERSKLVIPSLKNLITGLADKTPLIPADFK
jgi:hypothetical protein